MVQHNETAFLSILCGLSAVEALSGWRYGDEPATGEACPACGQHRPGAGGGGARFGGFISSYFPPEYAAHSERLYALRCRVLHRFSPAHFSATHGEHGPHLQFSGLGNGDVYLNDRAFLGALEAAAERYFVELRERPELQETMLARLRGAASGGAIHRSGGAETDAPGA
jgi:hypothetical protein